MVHSFVEIEAFRRKHAALAIATAWRANMKRRNGADAAVLFAAGSFMALQSRARGVHSTKISSESKMAKLLSHVDLDESEGARPVAEQLQDALAVFGVRIISLFRSFDTNRDGVISSEEFETGLCALGLDVPSAHIKALFDSWDEDGSGEISLKEMAYVLNCANVVKPLSGVDLDESPGAPPIGEQLKIALSINSVRIISLFKSWDNDGDGIISLDELETGLRSLGLDVPSSHIEGIYASWDIDGNGTLTLKELATVLNVSRVIRPLSHVDLDEGPDAAPISEQLKNVLAANSVHILTLFRTWDEVKTCEFEWTINVRCACPSNLLVCSYHASQDGDGLMSLSEFEVGLRTVRCSDAMEFEVGF